jgi:glycosyl transferase family 25
MTRDLSRLDVDAVLCISLKRREDRRAALLASFRDSGLDIEFFLVDKDEEDPQRGCYNSHLGCARTILERGYRRALILEDDCVLEDFSPKAVSRINRFLNTRNPEIFYLGLLLGKIWLTWHPGIARCRGAGTHAYIVSSEACRKMLGRGAYTGMAIDTAFSRLFKAYSAFPMMCFPDYESPSDIAGVIAPDAGAEKLPKGATAYRAIKRKQYLSVFQYWYKTLLLH